MIAEIFQDNRIEFNEQTFPEVEARKIALFYDAINWTHPELSADGRSHCFEDYMYSLSYFDQIISISEASKNDLLSFWRELSIEPSNVDAVLLGCDVSAYKGSQQNTKGSKLSVLYVSTLEPRKNHLSLLNACEALWREGAEFQLTLIGRRIEGSGRETYKLIESLIKKGRDIYWRETVTEDDLIRAYGTTTFTVYASKVEGFGLPILESLSAGVPCICNDHGAISEVAMMDGAKGCLMIDTSDVSILKDGIGKLLRDDQERLRLTHEARNRHFRSWEEYGEAFISATQIT
ncbi:MAG: glycosyltransferase [Verrucomicrobiota bacterium]